MAPLLTALCDRLSLVQAQTLWVESQPPPREATLALACGRLHEWHLADDVPDDTAWHPPLTLLAALACRQLAQARHPPYSVWIGRRCWPTFQLLTALGASLSQALFLDPLTDAERFWAIGQALRCPAVGAVVADAGGMTHLVSRRLQLAAESSPALVMLARPPWDVSEPTCAATRWEVRPQVEAQPGWSICRVNSHRPRGIASASCFNGQWTYQVNCGTGAFHLSPAVEHPAVVSAGGRGVGERGIRDWQASPRSA